NRFVEANRSTRDAVCEGGPLDELKDQRRDVARLLDAKNGSDVGMIERGDELSSPFEAREPCGMVQHFSKQTLQRDITLQARVACAIHGSHPTLSGEREDLVRTDASPFERRRVVGQNVGGHCPDRRRKENLRFLRVEEQRFDLLAEDLVLSACGRDE